MFEISGLMQLGFIVFVVLLIGAAAWVAHRYRAVGAFGLLGLALAPSTSVVLWGYSPRDFATLVAFGITALLFCIGLSVSGRKDRYFHIAALVVALFWPLLHGLISGLLSTFFEFVTTEAPIWVGWVSFLLVMVVVLMVVMATMMVFQRRRSAKRSKKSKRTTPATTT